MPKLKKMVASKTTCSSTVRSISNTQLLKFKRLFHRGAAAHFTVLPEAPGCTSKPLQLYGTIKEVSKDLARANDGGSGVFMVINRGGTRDRDIKRITAVFLDSDGQMTLEQILKLKPHLVVSTSPGRFHAYWLVSDLAVKDFKAFQRALAAKFGTDPSVCNPARLMRMPGTFQLKGEPHKVQIVHTAVDMRPERARRLAKRLGLDLDVQVAAKESVLRPDDPGSIAELQSALQFIPADDREVWRRVGLAIHDVLPNQQGNDVWTSWSRRSSKYDEDDQQRNWQGFVKGGGVTVSSLFWLAEKHGWKQGASRADGILPTNELALVDWLGAHAKDRIRYEVTIGKWLVFNAPTWKVDEPAAIRVVRDELQSLGAQAEVKGNVGAQALFKRYTSISAIRALLRDASGHEGLIVKRDNLDRLPTALAVANVVIDLTTGQPSSGQPEQLLTLQAPTKLEAGASCPRFLEFLDFVAQNDREYIAYLQRALGYTLFGHTNEQVFFVVFGESGNGKGTLFRILAHVLGPYVTTIAPNLLSRAYVGNPQGPSPAFMALKGPRMIQCSEGSDGQRFDSAFVKGLSGSDPLTGRATYGDQAQFTPEGKLWLSVNTFPEVPSQDKAMWRRLRVLPFNAKIKKRDGAFEDLLKAEAPGILNWLIEGALQFHQHRLGECKVVSEATSRARQSSDSVAVWIRHKCQAAEDCQVQSSEAYESYKKLCRLHGTKELSVQAFARAMNAKGYRTKSTKRCNVYIGLKMQES